MIPEYDATDSQAPLPAASVVEAYLYVWVLPCSICARGRNAIDLGKKGERLRILGTCAHCDTTDEFVFALPPVSMAEDPLSSTLSINPSEASSRLVDVCQWLTLHQMLLERADADPLPTERRWLRVRARQCLEEALRFYDEAQDLPPADAFWHPRSKEVFRDTPQRFTRGRLRSMLERLPVANGRGVAAAARRERKWWQFWRETDQ